MTCPYLEDPLRLSVPKVSLDMGWGWDVITQVEECNHVLCCPGGLGEGGHQGDPGDRRPDHHTQRRGLRQRGLRIHLQPSYQVGSWKKIII